MGKKLANIVIQIDGMTCVSCENRIENALRKTRGIETVNVSYEKGRALVTYDAGVIQRETIELIIESLDYRIRRYESTSKQASKQSPRHSSKTTTGMPQKTNIGQVLGVGILLLALYVIINQFGGFALFNSFPQAQAGMGYGLLFGIGLLTSVHCVAMCGGINLSQCARLSKPVSGTASKLDSLRPSLLYNTGRVISYTVIGGLVGGIGSVISFSGRAKGLVAIVAGVFMVIMGLNQLNLFPGLRKFNPRMPRIFARKINEQRAGASNSPLYVGLLNGLMPCGPLQAMQIYALSTGSPIKGALSMLFFSLGTVPLMFGLGALSSILSKRFTRKMMQVSAVLVIILGVVMFQTGFSLSGFALPSLTRSQSAATAKPANEATAPVIENGVQIVTTQLTGGRYAPITVQQGIPVKWTIQATADSINGCNNVLVIPAYNIEKPLEPGDNVIEFTPDQAGVIPYSCWMGMIRSKITVTEGSGAPVTSQGSSANTGNASVIPATVAPVKTDLDAPLPNCCA